MGSLFLLVRLFVYSITIVLIVNLFNDNDWGSNPGGFKYYIPETQQKLSNKMELFPPGFEPGTICELDRYDNHYTTETLIFSSAEVLLHCFFI